MARREKGEGSLYQAKDKTWVYQYTQDGKRKTKRFQRKADARAYIDSLQVAASRQAVTGVVQETVTVGEWMDRWLEKYARPTVKLSTYCSYELYIRAHIKPYYSVGHISVSRAESHHITHFDIIFRLIGQNFHEYQRAFGKTPVFIALH